MISLSYKYELSCLLFGADLRKEADPGAQHLYLTVALMFVIRIRWRRKSSYSECNEESEAVFLRCLLFTECSNVG